MHTVALAQHPIPDALWAEVVAATHLDAWQSQALGSSMVERAVCSAPQRSPSRDSLAAGRHPHSHGVMGLSHGGVDGKRHPQERHAAQLAGIRRRVVPARPRRALAQRLLTGTASLVVDEVTTRLDRWLLTSH